MPVGCQYETTADCTVAQQTLACYTDQYCSLEIQDQYLTQSRFQQQQTNIHLSLALHATSQQFQFAARTPVMTLTAKACEEE